MGVGPVAYNHNFAQLVTYLTWIYTHEFVIFSPIPQEVPSFLSLLQPLPPMVWLCFGGAIIFLAIIEHVFLAMQRKKKETQQHQKHMQIKDSGRIIIAMILFATIMFHLLYTESLESCLVAKEFEQPINTIQDLLHSGLTMHYPGKTAMGKYLEDYPSTDMKQIIKSQAKPFSFIGSIPSYVKDSLVFILIRMIDFFMYNILECLTEQLCGYMT